MQNAYLQSVDKELFSKENGSFCFEYQKKL